MTGDGEQAPGGEAGSLEREVERVSDRILDGEVPSPDAAGGAASGGGVTGAASTGADAAERAWFVGGVMAREGVPSPERLAEAVDKLPDPPARVDPGAPEGDIAWHATVLTDVAAGVIAEGRPGPGASQAAKHHYAMAVRALLLVVAVGAFAVLMAIVTGPGGNGGAGTGAGAAAVSPAPSVAVVATRSLATPADPPSPGSTPSDPAPTDVATPSTDPAATTAPTGGLVLRGPIDVSSMAQTGLKLGRHDVELVLAPEGGDVSGSFVIGMEKFPIGSLLTRAFGGDDDPAYTPFRSCTVRLTLTGTVTGTWVRSTGAMHGTAAFKPSVQDVSDCLSTRPDNVTVDPDRLAKPTTVTWSAKFDGSAATGTVKLTPALPFKATPAG